MARKYFSINTLRQIDNCRARLRPYRGNYACTHELFAILDQLFNASPVLPLEAIEGRPSSDRFGQRARSTGGSRTRRSGKTICFFSAVGSHGTSNERQFSSLVGISGPSLGKKDLSSIVSFDTSRPRE